MYWLQRERLPMQPNCFDLCCLICYIELEERRDRIMIQTCRSTRSYALLLAILFQFPEKLDGGYFHLHVYFIHTFCILLSALSPLFMLVLLLVIEKHNKVFVESKPSHVVNISFMFEFWYMSLTLFLAVGRSSKLIASKNFCKKRIRIWDNCG